MSTNAPSASKQKPRRPPRSGPPQRGVGPLLVLVAVAIVPALALLALFRATSPSEEQSGPAPTTAVAPPTPAATLTTPMLSMRRVAAELSRDISVDDFARTLTPFYGNLNDRSCVAVSVDGVPVGANNDVVPVIPASNQKLIVAAVALDVIGPDTTYTTSVLAAAAPNAGVIDGDLYLVGGGDPLLSSDWYPISNLERRPVLSPTSLDTLADRVRDAGVTTVNGDIVGDGTRYDDEYFAPGWGDGVAGLEAGPYDALLANDSRVLGEDQRASDPVAGAAREFARLLTERGITVGGSAISGTAPVDAPMVASIESVSLSDVVGEMLVNSDNNTAELMLKEIGFVGQGVGTRQAGLDTLSNKLNEWGIDTTALVLADGSGLGLDNRLTCASLLDVLQRYNPETPIGSGLPVAGETGALTDVFTDTEIAGRLLGKTGTLSNPPFNADPPAVKALSGYLTVDGGSAVEFALILNGPTISDQNEYLPVWSAFADVLATYPAGPTPAELGPR